MRPLKPEEREQILSRFPEEAHREVGEEIEEYQKLLSERLREDPNRVESARAAKKRGRRDNRIRELRAKLFVPEER